MGIKSPIDNKTLSNDKYSFLKDRMVTLSICINGQLLLSMVFEDLIESIPDSKLIMLNTDGGEIIIPRKYEELYFSICKKYENLFKIEMEFVDYQKMVIADCNNYIAVYTNGKTKTKGKFEYENIPLHKNKSHAIIPRAIYEYFVNNKPIEETIRNHQNIFDFCAGVKAKKSDKKGASRYELRWIENDLLKTQKLSKTVRYYISNKGKFLYKVYEDGSEAHVEAPHKKRAWKVTYFNKAVKHNNMSDYDIDYTYYISEARKQIGEIENIGQLTMF